MKKGDGSESTIIIGPSKSVLVYGLHSLEYVLGLARFRVFMSNFAMKMSDCTWQYYVLVRSEIYVAALV